MSPSLASSPLTSRSLPGSQILLVVHLHVLSVLPPAVVLLSTWGRVMREVCLAVVAEVARHLCAPRRREEKRFEAMEEAAVGVWGKKAQGQGLRQWIAKFAVFDKIRGYTSLSKYHSQGIHGLKHRVSLKERSWGLVPMNRGVSRLPVCDTFWHLTFTMLRRCSQSIVNKKTAF